MRFWITVEIFALTLTGCGEAPHDQFQGYVEDEYVQVASPIGGMLETLSVTRGQSITVDAPLFTLERAIEIAALSQADANAKALQARLAHRRLHGGGDHHRPALLPVHPGLIA